jgi:hypothetical protein
MQKLLSLAVLFPLAVPVLGSTGLDPVERAQLLAAQAPALADLRGGAPGDGGRLTEAERRILVQAADESPQLAELRGGESTGTILIVALAIAVLLVVLL